MYINKKSSFGLFLICAGAVLLLSSLGFDIWGSLMGYLLPILIIALGYYGIKKGNRFFGWIFFVIGVLMLLWKMAWIVGALIAIGIMACGISLWKRQRVLRRLNP